MKGRIIWIFLVQIAFPISCTKIPSNVLDLNDKFLDVMNNGFWFVEFYAPWCAHCKRLMPVWEQVGHALADKNSPVRLAKVDCTRFTSVASKLKVSAYPTLIFFRNGVQIPYEGERKKEALIQFAEKSAGPVIGTLDTLVKFTELKKQSDKEPFFVFVEGENDRDIYKQYDKVSSRLFTETRFFRASSSSVFPANVLIAQRPAVVLFKDGNYSVYDADREESLSEWIESERWTLMPQITESNIHTIAESTQKKLVLVVVDPVDRHNLSTSSGNFFEMSKETAQLVRDDPTLRKFFQFGWLDGNSLANSIVMGQMSVPNTFVFNLSTYEFYLSDDSVSRMTSKSFYTFLTTVLNGNSTILGGRSWPQRFRRMYYDITSNVYEMFNHQPILTMCLFGVPLAFFSIITYSICSADFSVDRDEIYPSEDDDDEEGSGSDTDHEKAD